MARKVDNIIKLLLMKIPVNRLFFDEIVEINEFIVGRARVNINDSWKYKSFDEFVGSFYDLEIFVMNFVWFCFYHFSFIYNDRNGLVFLMVCIMWFRYSIIVIIFRQVASVGAVEGGARFTGIFRKTDGSDIRLNFFRTQNFFRYKI